MKKNIFAVCDLEVDYALNFMDYLNQKKNIPFEIQAFTTVESLIAYGKNIHIELLLISQKAMCRQVQELEIGKIVILSEGVHPPDLDRYPSVYKYQASSDVVREVMACYGAEKAVAPAVFPVLKKTTEIYAVYSPLGRCLKTSFALTLGQILAKERAVLYLNLEEYSGFEEMLGKGFAQNLSDLLYFVRQENGNLIYKMNSMVQTINNLDFIPPVRTPEDIRGTAWEDWEKLIQEIVLRCRGKIFRTSDNRVDKHKVVVDNISKVIGRHTVCFKQNLIVKSAVFNCDSAVDHIVKICFPCLRNFLSDNIFFAGVKSCLNFFL